MLDYLTIVSLRSHFFKTNLISLALLQSNKKALLRAFCFAYI